MLADYESVGSRAAMSNLLHADSETLMISKGESRSHVYPHPPSPLHFTQLHYPKSTVLTPPPTPSRRHKRSSSAFRCCCCSCFAALCSVLLTLCTIVGLVAFITWLVLRPISWPRYSIESVEFNSINVTSSSSALQADVHYTITATNPNRRMGFRYDRMEFETSYQGHVFGRSAVAPFYQGHQNVSVFSSGFVVKSFVFTPESSRRTLASDWKAGRVALQLRGRAKVRVKVGVVTSMALNVHVDCDFVVAPSGKVTNKVCRTRS